MQKQYEARWISKRQAEAIRRSGELGRVILLDSLKGFIIVQPVGSNLADGDSLRGMEADFELDPAWCLDPKPKITEARKRLGLKVNLRAAAIP
jgi:hypothetical protein